MRTRTRQRALTQCVVSI